MSMVGVEAPAVCTCWLVIGGEQFLCVFFYRGWGVEGRRTGMGGGGRGQVLPLQQIWCRSVYCMSVCAHQADTFAQEAFGHGSIRT